MNKIILKKTGKSSKLCVIENELKQEIQKKQVKIKVSFSGVNFADLMMKAGLYPDAPSLPFCPGYEISGIILEIGHEVSCFNIGDEVIAGCYFGGYSSEIILDEWQVFKKPDYLNLEEGAGLPVSYITAYSALIELARVRKGDRILLDCATGSLGQVSVQLLKSLQCKIVGLTSSKSKLPQLEKLGIEGQTHEEFKKDNTNRFDVILNTIGGNSINEQYYKLKPLGRLVCLGAADFLDNGKMNLFKIIKGFIQMPRKSPITFMNDNKGIMGLNVLRLFEDPEIIMNIMEQLNKYKINPRIDRVFDYANVNEAFSYIDSKNSQGKVLLKWDQ